MASPVLTRNPAFQPNSGQNLGTEYGSPASTSVMTFQNTLTKTLTLFVIVLATAVIGWFLPIFVILPAAIAALVVGLIASFRKQPTVPLYFAYAALQGIAVGGISHIFESASHGAIAQALLGTFAVCAVTFGLFASGRVRATPKLQKFFIIAISGYLVFSLLNIVLVGFGVYPSPWGDNAATIFGIPLGAFIGVFAIILASISLILDYGFIKTGVDNRLPEKYGWTAAFGLMVTIVWLYLELLRLFGLSRN